MQEKINTKIFNGRAWARAEEEILHDKVRQLRDETSIVPKLVSVLVGDDPASKLYASMKQKVAQRLGMDFTVRVFEEGTSAKSIKKFIQKQNRDQGVHGIMIQMPLPGSLLDQKEEIVDTINPKKDVDGLRTDSPFVHPTAKAILEIIAIGLFDKSDKIVVVGSQGMVGSKLIAELKKQGLNFQGIDQETQDLEKTTKMADILVSTTGKANLIKGEMIKPAAVLIDVGAPLPEFERKSAEGKAKLITPVPGGIGPMTVVCLMQNLVAAAQNSYQIPV